MRQLWMGMLAGAALLAGSGFAAAQQPEQDLINPDRPGVADGSTVIGRRRIQLETAWQYEVHDAEDGQLRETFIPTLLRFGVTDRFELRVEGNTFSHQSNTVTRPATPLGSATGSDNGFAPLSAGIKYQLLDAQGRQPSVGVIVRVFPPSGSGLFKSNSTQADVRVAADWKINDAWSLNPNAGIGRLEADSGETFAAGLFALTLNYQPTDRINPFVDVGGVVPGSPGAHASVLVDYGIAWILGRNVQLDASIGHRVRGDAPHPFVSLGFSVRGGRGTH